MTPLTLDQLRAAMHPDDWTDHVVTHRDAELLGLSFRYEDAEAKFHAWMSIRGWSPRKQAAGCVRWHQGSEFIWLDGGVSYAIAAFICALRGDEDLLPQHGHIVNCDTRPGLDILAEIVNTQPTDEHHAAVERWDGGGTFIATTR
jgi:hypothetical protein